MMQFFLSIYIPLFKIKINRALPGIEWCRNLRMLMLIVIMIMTAMAMQSFFEFFFKFTKFLFSRCSTLQSMGSLFFGM